MTDVINATVAGLRGPAADTTALDAAAAVLTLAKRLPKLTTPGAAYHAVYSTQRLIDGVGPLVDATDGAGGPITALAGSEEGVSLSATRSVRDGSDAARVTRVYDQTGNGRHLYQDDAAKRPALHEDVAMNGSATLIMDGRRAGIGDATQRGLKFDGWALDGQANTRFIVLDPTDSAAAQLYERFTAANPAGARNLYTRSDDTSPYAPDHGAKLQYAGSVFSNLPSSPCVIVIRDRLDGTDIFYNTVKVSKAVPPSAGALQSGIIGYGEDAGLASFNVAARYLAYGAINKAISDGEISAIVATLTARFNLAPESAPRVVLIGDSIGEATRTTLTRGRPFYARPRLKRPIRFYNLALSSRWLAHAFAQRADLEGNGELYQADRTCIAIIQGGINDIHVGGSTGNDLYLNITTPYVTYLRNMGWKVIVCTLLPQTANNVAFAEPARQEYNTYVRNNTAGADVICDLAADPVMGVYPDAPNNAALFYDKIHPTARGYAYEAPTMSAAINTLL